MNPDRIQQGDAVGIGIHTANALRGYEIGKMARKRSAYVIFGGIHATLYPEEALELGGAHAVVKGDGDIVWAKALADCREGAPKPVYAGGQIEASDFVAARWDLVPRNRWEKTLGASPPTIAGIPLTRRWLIPQALRPKLYWSHPIMSAEEIRSRTQAVWDSFYSFGSIWKRSRFIKSSRGRLAFLLISKIYRQMYADTGIATDSARVSWSGRWARWLAKPCRHLFAGTPMPDLQVPMT
jgi:hypothetical protein